MVEITKILSEAFGKIRLSTISSIVFFVCRSEKKYIITRVKKKGKRNNKRQKEEERIKRMKEKKMLASTEISITIGCYGICTV